MGIEGIILSELSLTGKDKYHMKKKTELIDTEKRSVVAVGGNVN